MTTQAIFIDPSARDFLNDRLFDLDNHHLNRDGVLIPFARLRDYFSKQGIPVHTADKLRDGSERREINHYWSMGLLSGYKSFIGDESIKLRGFLLFEPPLVQPEMYKALPIISKHFEEVYIHNIVGDGYSLDGVVSEALRKLYWAQPYSDILPEYWNNDERLNKLVVIAGNHNPRGREPEFYSERIRAIATLSKRSGIDLFGHGWGIWWRRRSFWWPYWRYRSRLMSSYRGICASKWDVLSKYRFSLCFENSPMLGYLTEKIFDCLYAGTVPVYWGAPDIAKLVPPTAFIDMRKFSSYDEMFNYTQSMKEPEWIAMREAGREFLRTQGPIYRDSLLRIMHI